MAALPQPQNTTARAIYALHEQRVAAEPPRDYLGWSELGEPCERRLWYGFRHAGREAIGGQLARLFDTGHREEARVLDELKALGYEVFDRDPATGGQFAIESHGGHLRGHLDAVVRGLPEAAKTWHLFDVKTIKAKKFDELLKKGLRAMYPKYYAQGQGYMGHQGLDRAAFLFACKDDDRIHLERFEFDAAEFKKLEQKAGRIIDASEPPQRLSEDPAWFECKFCPFHALCHGQAVPEVNCRTCAHSTPDTQREGGTWTCTAGTDRPLVTIPLHHQRMAHDCHRFIPALLVNLAEPVDSDGDAVTYRAADGREFTNGPRPGLSSVELRAGGLAAAIDPTTQRLLQQFPTAKVTA